MVIIFIWAVLKMLHKIPEELIYQSYNKVLEWTKHIQLRKERKKRDTGAEVMPSH